MLRLARLEGPNLGASHRATVRTSQLEPDSNTVGRIFTFQAHRRNQRQSDTNKALSRSFPFVKHTRTCSLETRPKRARSHGPETKPRAPQSQSTPRELPRHVTGGGNAG